MALEEKGVCGEKMMVMMQKGVHEQRRMEEE